MDLLLVHPPGARISEPFSSVARLSGELKSMGIEVTVWDASAHLVLDLLRRPLTSEDIWTRRALSKVHDTIAMLQSPRGYTSLDRYRNAINDLNRILAQYKPCEITLTDFKDPRAPSLQSEGLRHAAQHWWENPFASSFLPLLQEWLSQGVKHVGFSLSYLSQAPTAFAMAGAAKALAPKVTVSFGGGLVKSWLSQRGFENPWSGVVDQLFKGGAREVSQKLFGVLPHVGPRPGAHDYTFVEPSNYLSPGLVLPFSVTTGCNWRRCTFCPERYERTPYELSDPQLAREELEYWCAKLQPVLVHLTDNEVSPSFVKALMERPPAVPWYGFSRFYDELEDREYVRRLRRAGCVMLQLGLESGDQGVLTSLQKGIRLERVKRTMENLNAEGIIVYAYLLFGTPSETREAAQRTMEFCVEHASLLDFLNLAVFNLPRTSPQVQTVKRKGAYSADLSLYVDFEHPKGWHRGEIRRFLSRFRSHPALRPIVMRTPPSFTSNHAPFLALHRPQLQRILLRRTCF